MCFPTAEERDDSGEGDGRKYRGDVLTHRGVSEWWGGIDDTSPDVLNLRRELFYLWVFIAKEELLE